MLWSSIMQTLKCWISKMCTVWHSNDNLFQILYKNIVINGTRTALTCHHHFEMKYCIGTSRLSFGSGTNGDFPFFNFSGLILILGSDRPVWPSAVFGPRPIPLQDLWWTCILSGKKVLPHREQGISCCMWASQMALKLSLRFSSSVIGNYLDWILILVSGFNWCERVSTISTGSVCTAAYDVRNGKYCF